MAGAGVRNAKVWLLLVYHRETALLEVFMTSQKAEIIPLHKKLRDKITGAGVRNVRVWRSRARLLLESAPQEERMTTQQVAITWL